MENKNWHKIRMNSISKQHLFLYEYIPPKSKILIYGLGQLGKDYIQQIQALQYCTILAVSDQNEKKSQSYPFPYVGLSSISSVSGVDYYVIAIDSEYTASRICYELIRQGIPRSAIVNVYMREGVFPLPEEELQAADSNSGEDGNRCMAAVRISGGIGDHIISLGFVRRLTQFSDSVLVDVYADVPGMESVFDGVKGIRSVYYRKDIRNEDYDLVLLLRHLVHVVSVKRNRVGHYSGNLLECVEKTIGNRKLDDLGDEVGRDLEILKRAEILGYDRYRMLGDGSLWNLSEDMARLEVDEAHRADFERLNLGAYITVNYGAGNEKVTGGKTQTKVWPYEHFVRFCAMFREAFPGISVVQLGGEGCREIAGVDLVAAGRDLQTVKHILKHSLVHIDCEGGLVHLATQLGTKCIVLFGPTPVWYYGYPQNVNIVSGACRPCMAVSDQWYTACVRQQDPPPCMNAITPEMVLKETAEWMHRIILDI